MKYPNVYKMFFDRTAEAENRPAYFVRRENGWRSATFGELRRKVQEAACGFRLKGLSAGAGVAILAGNIPEWTISDIAAIAAGGIGVGLYPTASAEQCEYIINHSDAEFVIVDTPEQLGKIRRLDLPRIKEIFVVNPTATSHGERVSPFSDLLEAGRRHLESTLPQIEKEAFAADSEDIAIMVYTSGTTGDPKGARLSHRYILNSVESLRRCVPIFETDITMSYLPGCHVAERISGIYNRLYNLTPVYYIDDLSRLYEYITEIKPTVFASLPRFFEKIRSKLLEKYREDEISPAFVRDAFGGRIRLLTSGGAPLPEEVADFFARAGLPILQAYGLTENVCVAFNTETAYRFGTAGRPMPMCQVRIADDGEIRVKSEMMFSGYHKDPEATAAMFTEDGWLKTGDLGSVDEEGFLRITGRKKEIIVLSTGKNIAPAAIENAVKESHLISHCFVYGEGRSYLVALISINSGEAGRDRAEIERETEAAVKRANSRFSRTEQIKKFLILNRDFSIERGEVTPTGKLRRNVIAETFRSELEKLYED